MPPASAQSSQEASEDRQERDDGANADGERDDPGADGDEDTSSRSQPRSYTYSLRGQKLVVRSGDTEVRTADIPCEPASTEEDTALARQDDRLLVACGVEGIHAFDLTDPGRPKSVGFREVDGAIAGFFRADGRLWIRIETERAQPAAAWMKERREPTPSEPPERPPEEEMRAAEKTDPRTETPGEPRDETGEQQAKETSDEVDTIKGEKDTNGGEPARGRVVESRPGVVVVDFGEADDLESGDSVEFYRRKEIKLGSGERTKRTETVAIGEATTVSPERSKVKLGMNEQVQKGVDARQISGEGPTANPIAPSRVGGMASVSFMVRPVLPLNTIGIGSAGDASFKWTFPAPLMLEVRGDPIGFGVGTQPSVGSLAGEISLSFDSRLFRVGLGMGGSGIATPRRAFGSSAPIIKGGVTVVQVARFGARDGLQMTAYNSLIAFDGAFRWGDIKTTGQVPLERFLDDTWLIFTGAHQRAGQAYGDIGLRVLTSGNGRAGSTYLRATLGGGGVWGSREVECPSSRRPGIGDVETCTEPVNYIGPLVGFGLEQRF